MSEPRPPLTHDATDPIDAEFARIMEREEGLQHERETLAPGALFQWSLVRILLILCLLWSVKVFEQVRDVSLSDWGLLPRTAKGLLGILTMPFLHSGFDHLYHNSFGLLLLGLGLFFLYPKVAWRVLLISAFAGSALVWCFARDNYHIGASGVVYSLSAFLFLSGLLRHDRMSRGGALIVAILYGATVWGVLPLQEGISWEGHLFGATVGAALAVIFRKVDLPPKDEMLDDEVDPADSVGTAYWQIENEDEENGASQDDPYR